MLAWKLLMVAGRNLRRNARRSVITGVVILTGTLMMFLSGAVGDGVEKQLLDSMMIAKFGHLLTSSVDKQVDYADPMELPKVERSLLIDRADYLVQMISEMQGVEAAGRRLFFIGLLSLSDGAENLPSLFMAIEPDREPLLDTVLAPVEGTFLSSGDKDVIYIGGGAAGDLGVGAGDKVKLTCQTIAGGTVSRTFTVIGIFDASTELNVMSYMPFRAAADLLGTGGQSTDIIVFLEDPRRATEFANELNAEFRAQALSLKAEPWEETLAFYLGIVSGNHTLVMVTRVLLAAVVIVGIMSTSVMSVQERIREIGTLMALGYRRWHILFLFVGETSLLGSAASASGILLGLGVGAALSQLSLRVGNPIFSVMTGSDRLKLAVTSTNLWLTVGITLATTLLASVYPALVAARQQPVKALRHA